MFHSCMWGPSRSSLKKCSGFLSDCPSGLVPESLRLSRLSTTNTDVVFPSAMAISYPPGEIQGEDKVWQAKSNCALPRRDESAQPHIVSRITSNKSQAGLVCVCVCKDTAKIQLCAPPVRCTVEHKPVCVKKLAMLHGLSKHTHTQRNSSNKRTHSHTDESH